MGLWWNGVYVPLAVLIGDRSRVTHKSHFLLTIPGGKKNVSTKASKQPGNDGSSIEIGSSQRNGSQSSIKTFSRADTRLASKEFPRCVIALKRLVEVNSRKF